ncbi:MAG: tripartite tricarboxylate transporter substrate binding protein [Burkholderiales bacterium]|nr:tripartite tricarboxylate transporter substrate binding protein [Burkholderiales bacterium]
MLVGFPPGGSADILARAVAHKMTEAWNQQVLVENRPGAAGTIAAAAVAKSPPDGYTILMAALASQSIAPSLFKSLPYDSERDFAAISNVAELALVLVVNPALPVKSVKELIALAKARPGELNYGSGGVGSSQHLATELFSMQAGVRMVHVPYKGSPLALADLLAGQTVLSIDNPTTVLPQVKLRKLRPLAVSSARRWPAVPELPTIAEAAALPGFEVIGWFGVVATAGTPAEVVTRLNVEIGRILKLPDVKQRLSEQGAEAAPSTPQQFAALISSDKQKYAKVVRATGMQPQ